MIIHNATFMMQMERETEFIGWLRERITKLEGLRNPRVSAMREAGGVDYRHAEAQSIAFQTEFDTIDHARRWSATVFSGIAASFEESFGPQAMVFVSLFETV